MPPQPVISLTEKAVEIVKVAMRREQIQRPPRIVERQVARPITVGVLEAIAAAEVAAMSEHEADGPHLLRLGSHRGLQPAMKEAPAVRGGDSRGRLRRPPERTQTIAVERDAVAAHIERRHLRLGRLDREAAVEAQIQHAEFVWVWSQECVPMGKLETRNSKFERRMNDELVMTRDEGNPKPEIRNSKHDWQLSD